MCPTSNDQVVGIDAPGERRFGRIYPLKDYLKPGLLVTIDTDNPGISGTSLSAEYLKAALMSDGGLRLWDVLRLVRQGFAAAFLSYHEGQEMLVRIDGEVHGILGTHGLSGLDEEADRQNRSPRRRARQGRGCSPGTVQARMSAAHRPVAGAGGRPRFGTCDGARAAAARSGSPDCSLTSRTDPRGPLQVGSGGRGRR